MGKSYKSKEATWLANYYELLSGKELLLPLTRSDGGGYHCDMVLVFLFEIGR